MYVKRNGETLGKALLDNVQMYVFGQMVAHGAAPGGRITVSEGVPQCVVPAARFTRRIVFALVSQACRCSNLCRVGVSFRWYEANAMLARKILAACCTLMAAPASAWAEQPNPKAAVSASNHAEDYWRPYLGLGVVGGYGQLPGPAAGFMTYVGMRRNTFSVALETRFLYDFIVENPKAPNVFLFSYNIALPLCTSSRLLHGCIIVQYESLKYDERLIGIPLYYAKSSHKLGAAIRGGINPPPLSTFLGEKTQIRVYMELGLYASPRRVEFNDKLLWQSGMFHFALGCTYGL